MTLVRRNDDLFQNFWNDIFDCDIFGVSNASRVKASIPAVNIKETEDNYSIELAAPGMTKEDFELNLDNGVLHISSEQKMENETKDEKTNFTRREFNYSSFKRSFTLPNTADLSKINATYKNGLLEIDIPKKEEAKPKPIKLIEIS
ncbi:MAG: molecular chaperone Hsp20 [Marinilabiliales bacterium]|nr:MAG: molecular chaperone Hsp20 [Marinilabiliales bacterium]